jgi:hypothetical protein
MKPTICRMVVYRNREGVDMPAVVTGHDRNGDPFLHGFPPPGATYDGAHHEWGIRAAQDPATPTPMSWRWPARENT